MFICYTFIRPPPAFYLKKPIKTGLTVKGSDAKIEEWKSCYNNFYHLLQRSKYDNRRGKSNFMSNKELYLGNYKT